MSTLTERAHQLIDEVATQVNNQEQGYALIVARLRPDGSCRTITLGNPLELLLMHMNMLEDLNNPALHGPAQGSVQ